ncbi:MAG: PD-(D/E)XK nuclease family protein, partial [Gemmatimonadaceae bacterium]
PGALHLTHVSQAGATGRPHVYLLGMDAQRTSGALPVDPILDDDTRKALGPALPSARERADRRDRALYRALNGLHGNVRVSYATQSDAGPREASPSPVLLQMARHVLAQPELTYDQFRAELGEPAGAARGNDPLDRRDVWLRALAGGPLMLDGRAQVRAAWPSLARGLRLHAAADGDAVTEWHGIVPDAAGKTRPFADASRWTSPSSLELLGACPLAWFYRYALELRLPEDEQRDATQWLDPAQRGVLLHRVLERFVREWMSRQGELDGAPARDALLAVLDDELERERQTTTPPSELAFLRDRVWADRAARHFLFQEREWRDAEWLSVEAHFPAAGERAEFVAADGTRLAIGGRIDRVDRYPDGSLRIVDYKSGSNYAYRNLNRDGLLNGGRVLQPAIYAAGAGQALGSEIRQFEYRFTKGHPPDDRIALDADALAGAPAIVASLLTHLRSGQFIPTDCADDCKFCDFRSICRVQGTDPVRSPRAEWGKEHGADAGEYAEMRKRRGEEGEP